MGLILKISVLLGPMAALSSKVDTFKHNSLVKGWKWISRN
jgi:hypothetical protein